MIPLVSSAICAGIYRSAYTYVVLALVLASNVPLPPWPITALNGQIEAP